jgi:hypothetical protein
MDEATQRRIKYGTIQPKRLKLYNALNIGYFRNEAKQRKRLKRFGYVLDGDLTNRERMVAYNPTSRKLLYVSNGTDFTNSNDLANDLLVGMPISPQTRSRVVEEKNTLLKAKQKYGVDKATVLGHSLGGNIVHYIGSAQDKIIGYNPALFNQKPRPNVTILKAKRDPFSRLANNATVVPGTEDITVIKAHNLENIREEPIFV